MHGRQYTWGNNLPQPTFEKLDRILCSVEWEETYPLTKISALCREKSDHVPLFLDTGDVVKTDPIFRFENSWFLREGPDELVINSWKSTGSKISSLDNWQTKLRCLRPKLKGWNRNMNAWYRELKRDILGNLTI